MDACSANYSKPLTCFDHRNSSVLDVIHATVPNCQSGHWQPLTPQWKALFYTHVALFGSLFLLLAVWCVVCLWKHHALMRLRRTKIFIAVDVTLMILGFSRAIFYVLDPYGISGYCSEFACVVVSRILASLTLPSLTASYTLVFFILWHVSTVNVRRSKFQRWKIIVPICFALYSVAVAVELVCAFTTYPAIFLLLACEFAFIVGGLAVCVTFLFVGLKILKSVRRTAQETSTVIRDASLARIPTLQLGKSLSVSVVDRHVLDSHSNAQVNGARPPLRSGGSVSFANQVLDQPEKFATSNAFTSPLPSRKKTLGSTSSKAKLPASKHHNRAIRKVSIITYAAAVLGGLYCLFALTQLILLIIKLFGACPEDEIPHRSNPYVWITFRYVSSVMELLLACLLVYSVNEIRPVVKILRNVLRSMLHCRNEFQSDDTQTTEQHNDSKDYNRVKQRTYHPSVLPKQEMMQMASEASIDESLSANKTMDSAENLIAANLHGSEEGLDHEDIHVSTDSQA